MKILSMFLLWLTCLTPGEAEKTFYRAFYQESALRRMEAAATSYGQAAEQALDAGDEGLHVKALLGQARCLRALGRLEESGGLFARALELDPQNPEAQTALETKQVGEGVDPVLALRIQALVQELGGEGRENAKKDLDRIGALAIPFLEEGLRSRDVSVVELAADLLAKQRSAPAAEALRSGLTDPEVLFPALLVQDFYVVPINSATRNLWETALAHESVEVRRLAIQFFSQRPEEAPPDQVVLAVRRVLGDQDAVVRATALGMNVKWESLVEELRPFFRSNLKEERLRAIQIAGVHKALTPTLAGDLLEALHDRDTKVRAQAAWVFAGADPATLDGALLAEAGLIALSDEDLAVQVAGASILSRTTMPWPDPVREAVNECLRRYLVDPPKPMTDGFLELIRPMGGPGLPEQDLVKLYVLAGRAPSDPSLRLAKNVRRSILGRLRWLFADRAAGIWSPLVAAMRATEDEAGQELLLERAPKLVQGDPFRDPIQSGPRSLLLTAAGSEFPGVRQLAYRSLSADPDPACASLPHLPADLGAEDLQLSKAAFALVQQYPRSEFAEAARAFLSRRFESRHAQQQMIRFYVKCEGSAAAPVLLDLLLRGQGHQSEELIHQLSLLRGEKIVPDLLALAARDQLPFLIARQIADPSVLTQFVLALPAEQVSVSLLKGVETRIPESALETLLRAAFDSADSATQAEACRLAGLAAFESTLPKLTELLESNTYLVRNAADAAVRAIQERKYRRLTAELLGPAGQSAALERALGLIRSDDPVKRQGGALALGALGDPAAIPALLDLLEDGDTSVRRSAVQALENLGRQTRAGGE